VSITGMQLLCVRELFIFIYFLYNYISAFCAIFSLRSATNMKNFNKLSLLAGVILPCAWFYLWSFLFVTRAGELSLIIYVKFL